MSTELKTQKSEPPATRSANYRRPYYTVRSNKNHYTVEVFLPGVSKGDYSVSLHHNELFVEGRKSIPIPTGAHWVHREISPESYKLHLQLNVNVDPEKITAKSVDGILEITLPVAKEALPRTIKIN